MNIEVDCEPDCGSWNSSNLLTDHEQIAIVLAVDFSVVANRKRSVGSTQSFQQEDSLLPLRKDPVVALRNRVDVSVFASDIDQPVDVDDRRVDAPLVAIGMLRVEGRVLEGPF